MATNSKEYTRAYRQAHPRNLVAERAARKRYYLKNRALLDSMKDVPCADCGGTFPPECMDFDHVRGTKSFGLAVRINRKQEALIAEAAKCDVVCANCHRIRTRSRKVR